MQWDGYSFHVWLISYCCQLNLIIPLSSLLRPLDSNVSILQLVIVAAVVI
jgi:hypothetical protein